MKQFIYVVMLSVFFLTACTTSRMSMDTLPAKVKLDKQVSIPNDTTIAIYLPATNLSNRFYLENSGIFIDPGLATKEAVDKVMKTYFTAYSLFEPSSDKTYGMLLDLNPEWDFSYGSVEMKLSYTVYGANRAELMKGEKSFKTETGSLQDGNGFYNAVLRSLQLAVIDILNKLKPNNGKYPNMLAMKDMAIEQLVNKDKPLRTGTGFYVNSSGQLLTAAHVSKDCALLEIKDGAEKYSGTLAAHSNILDLALINTHHKPRSTLPVRKNSAVKLGEFVSMIGFPLQGVLADSPNLTRGNVSSMSGMQGSAGQLQFSAPIQPGSSGGPIVSETGELLGVTLSTLSTAKMVEKGILPQNVNFALHPKHVEKFLNKYHVPFQVFSPKTNAPPTSYEDALPAVVQIACYQ